MSALYRQLPKVDLLLADPRVAALPRGIAVATCRGVLDRLRADIAAGRIDAVPDVPAEVVQASQLLLHGRLRRVINATGVVVHTNLGRSVWAPEAVAAAVEASGYCNLQMELETGQRGGRMAGVQALLAHLTGAEAAIVVNNCAAAVLLALTALARDREVVVSRGELVEIGGSFRVPDVIASGGARLREVGTTNRTRASDFEAAIGEQTAVLLRVHPSNFKIVGFTEGPSRTALASVARAHGVPLLEDLGSGSLDGSHGEPAVRQALAEGVDIAMFSGDKLLGGPQAGLLVGRADLIARLRRHPLYRALRVDKVILAALEATLVLHARGERPPTLARIERSAEELATAAGGLADALRAAGVTCATEPDEGFVGGGALPGQGLPGTVVVLRPLHPDRVAHALRTGDPAIVVRVSDGSVRVDPRTLAADEVPQLVARVAQVCGLR